MIVLFLLNNWFGTNTFDIAMVLQLFLARLGLHDVGSCAVAVSKRHHHHCRLQRLRYMLLFQERFDGFCEGIGSKRCVDPHRQLVPLRLSA